jgi:hypothetical protein
MIIDLSSLAGWQMCPQIQGLIITRSVNYPQLLIDPFVTESMPSSALQQYLTAYRGINDWHLYAFRLIAQCARENATRIFDLTS